MWYNDYVGIPYKDNGRNKEGADCWGLARLIYKDRFDIELPSFTEFYSGTTDVELNAELIARQKESWKKSESPKMGDVVLFRILGNISHIGIYLDNNKFIHAREGHASVIEDLASSRWKSRVAGFYEYNENTTTLTSVPHPFKTEKFIERDITPGTSIKELYDKICANRSIVNTHEFKTTIIVNGKVVPDVDWDSTKIKLHDKIEYRTVPRGDNPLRMVLMVAVMIAAPQMAPGIAAELAGAEVLAGIGTVAIPASAAMVSAVQMGLTVVGMALVNAIAPVRLPNQNRNDPGSSNPLNVFSGGSNKSNPYGAIPIVLGKIRYTPPLAAKALLEATEYSSFVKMILCWGFGPLQLDEGSLMIGNKYLSEYVVQDGLMPEMAHLDLEYGANTNTSTTIDTFNKIYSKETVQVFPSDRDLAYNNYSAVGEWHTYTINSVFDINSFQFVISFPEGLRKVYTMGLRAGEADTQTVDLEYQYTTITDTGWTSLPVQYKSYKLDAAVSIALPGGGGAYDASLGVDIVSLYPGEYYRWHRVCLKNGRIVIIAGAGVTDKYSEPTNLNEYSYYNPAGTAVKRLPDIPSDCLLLYDICVTGTRGVTDTVSHLSSYSTTPGGAFAISFSYNPGRTAPGGGWGQSSTGYLWTISQIDTILVNIAAGTITSNEPGDSGTIISFSENRKDAFNYISDRIPVPLGKYKFRIRRKTRDYADLTSIDDIYGFCSSPVNYLPSSADLSLTAGRFYVYQGTEQLELVTTATLENQQWRVVSITNSASISRPSADYSNNQFLFIPDLSSFDTSASSWSTTVTIDAKTRDGSVIRKNIVQTFYKSTATNKYWIALEGGDSYDAYSGGYGRFQITGSSGVRLVDTLTTGYWTVEYNDGLSSGTESSTYNLATNYNFRLEGYHNYEDGTNNTALIDTKYAIIRLYDDAVKTNKLVEFKIPARNTVFPSGTDLYRNFYKTSLYTLTGYSDVDAFSAPVVEGADCKIARTAIRLESSSKVNGQIDGINGVVQTVCLDYDSITDTWITRATNNPASLFYYILKHPANAQRIKTSEVSTRIDLANLKEWHIYCKAKGFTFNTVVENVNSVLDILKDIAAAGRASPCLVDGKWGVVIDTNGKPIVQHFSPYNSWGFEATKIIPRVPHALRSIIRDEEDNYQDREVVIVNAIDGYSLTNAELFEEISLPGITNYNAATAHLQWHMAQARARSERYTINTDMEYLVCNRGDVVKVSHDVPLWGSGAGRIKSISGNTITLDENILLQASTNYVIRVRLNISSPSYVVKSIPSVTATGYYSSFTLDSTTNMEEGNLVLFGTTDTAINTCLVLNIEPLDNKNARITLVDYAEDIFTADLGTSYPNVTIPPTYSPPTNLTDAITTYPEVLAITSDRYSGTDLTPGTVKYNIRIVTGHQNVPSTVRSIELQYNESSADISTGTVLPFGLTEPVLLDNITIGKTYNIRIRYKGTDGRTGPWSIDPVTSLAYYTHTVAQDMGYDDDVVINIDIDLDRTNLILNLQRDKTIPIDFSHYELRVVKDPDSILEGDFWDLADNTASSFYNSFVKLESITGNGIYVNLLDFTTPRFDANGVTYRIACRSVSTDGRTSFSSRIRSYLLTALT